MIIIDFGSEADIPFLHINCIISDRLIKYKISDKELLIAKLNGHAVGYLALEFLWGHIPFIAFIWIDEKNRRKGVGESLLKFLEKHHINSR